MWVIFESSRARIMPSNVTMIAASFVEGGMVIGGVFEGRMKDVMRKPARMLPKARRVIGLVIRGLFSLIGEIEGRRLYPVWTRMVRRKL